MKPIYPLELLREALRDIPHVEFAAIFGSFAARSAGAAGSTPHDIDVVIVGEPDRPSIYTAVSSVEESAAREINVTFLSRERWERDEEEIVKRIKAGPLLNLLT